MENSEISQPSLENSEDRSKNAAKDAVGFDLNGSQPEKTGNSGTKTREDVTRKRRPKSAKKEGRREVGVVAKL